jgi:3-deoxy-manno-octulosonate cytidylyltransferase (CMP-KDO synthetase)
MNQTIMKIAIVVPARLNSTRLVNKMLILIDGKPLFIHTLEKASLSNYAKNLYVATDNLLIQEAAIKYGYQCIMTDISIATGTDRIYNACQLLNNNFDIIVNLQGDMPNINPNTLNVTIDFMIKNHHKFDIVTAITPWKNDEDLHDPSNVSAIVSHITNQVLYFTRYPIKLKNSYKHLGLYVYKKDALEKFVQLSQSSLELDEQLEQLRAMENGMTIGFVLVQDNAISVDTNKDLNQLLNISQ